MREDGNGASVIITHKKAPIRGPREEIDGDEYQAIEIKYNTNCGLSNPEIHGVPGCCVCPGRLDGLGWGWGMSLQSHFFGVERRAKTRVLLDDLSGLRIEYRPKPGGIDAINFRRYAPAQQFDTAWQAAKAAWAEILRNNTEDTL